MSHPVSVSPPEPKPDSLRDVSICIAAYNESSTIGRLLDQLIAVTDPVIDEVVVCANGCTDGTEAIVCEYMTRDPRVRLISSPKGKPAAWNALMSAARNDVRLFLDADVELAPGFFRHIRDALTVNPASAIIAARDLPKRGPGRRSTLLATFASRPFGFDYVSGRAYAFRLRKMPRPSCEPAQTDATHILNMPLDILHEDFWLEVAAGRSLIAFCPFAKIYYDPGTVDDLLKTRARLRVARQQVAAMMPAKFAQWRRDSIRSHSFRRRLLFRFGTMDGPRDAIACVVGALSRWVLLAVFSKRVRSLESTMRSEMAEKGGQVVLASSGRLTKVVP